MDQALSTWHCKVGHKWFTSVPMGDVFRTLANTAGSLSLCPNQMQEPARSVHITPGTRVFSFDFTVDASGLRCLALTWAFDGGADMGYVYGGPDMGEKRCS